MRVHTILILASILFSLAETAYPQEVAQPGLVADFTDAEETIVVTGHRIIPELPLPYESVLVRSETTFTAERNMTGRTHYTFTRPLYSFGGESGIEFHREWHDGRGSELVPENEPPDLRLVTRW